MVPTSALDHRDTAAAALSYSLGPAFLVDECTIGLVNSCRRNENVGLVYGLGIDVVQYNQQIQRIQRMRQSFAVRKLKKRVRLDYNQGLYIAVFNRFDDA